MNPIDYAERLFRRVQNMVQVGTSTTAAIDSGNAQTVQVKTHRAMTRDGVPVLYVFGVSSSPPVGSDLVVLNVAGDSSNGFVISTAHKASRPRDLLPGQTALYDQAGSQLHLDNAGTAALQAATAATVASPAIEASGNVGVGSGATGSFTTPTGQVVTVRDGIITNIF